MNKSMLAIGLVLPIVLSGCSGGGSMNDSSSYPIVEETVSIDIDSETKAISEGIYGQFIEFLNEGIYSGIWSELIMDRKFYSPIGEDSSMWSKCGGGLVDSVTDRTYSGSYGAELHGGSGISQRGLALDEKGYSGYFYALGSGSINVSLYTSDSTTAYQGDISISSPSSFSKYQFDVPTLSARGKYRIELSSTSGDIIIDSISMMPEDNISGMRKDSIELLKTLNAPFYRWPGGNFVSGYSWKDGIGDRDARKNSRNIEYAGAESDFASHDEMVVSDIMNIESRGFCGTIDPNDFGIDEFITFCRLVDAEPNIVVNSGLGSSEDASNEVAYCNSLTGTWANKRPHIKPYAVKLWSIGNEMNGDWELGHVDISEYVTRHRDFYNRMKAVDDSIEIIAVGDNTTNWTRTMLNNCGDEMDYISEHFYAEIDNANLSSHITNLRDQALTRIKNHRAIGVDIPIAFDEYAYDKASLPSRTKDGMGVASCLNAMIANADVVKLACYSSSVNITQGCITTDDYGAVMQGAGLSMMLYRNHNQGNYIPCTYTSDNVNGYFEAITTISEAKDKVSVSVINYGSEAVRLETGLASSSITRYSMAGKYPDSYNETGNEEIRYSETVLDKCLVEPYSVSVFVISI